MLDIAQVLGLIILICIPQQPATARITPEAYRAVGIDVPERARVPREAYVVDETGHHSSLGNLLTKPSVLVFADYTCTTLCGPIVAFVATALEQSGMPPNEFQVLVVSLDPKDTVADAKRMRIAHLGVDSPINPVTSFITADETTVQSIATALGYRYAYDQETDQFVHPGAAYILTSDGRVARVLAGLGISPADLRLALVEAGEGRVGTLADQVRLLCSGFDPAHGTYNLRVWRLLAAVATATTLTLGGGIALLWLLGRHHPA
jgi:protein SCO1/2